MNTNTINKNTIKLTLILLGYLSTLAFIEAKVYEDAEDSSIARWIITDTTPLGATIQNLFDEELHSRVMEFRSVEDYANQFEINIHQDKKVQHILKWDFKTRHGFIIDVMIDSVLGERYLRYTDNHTNHKGIDKERLYFGLGYHASNGNWHTFTRNVVQDLKEVEPTNHLKAIKSIQIRATGRIDNLELFASPEKIYENAEDKNTSNWRPYLNTEGISIKNLYDTQLQSRVIELKGTEEVKQYILGDTVKGKYAWRDKQHNHLQWRMQTNQKCLLYLHVETARGVRHLKYDDKHFSNKGLENKEVYHALGTEASDGKWHTYIRDIEADIKAFEPNNTLLYVDGLQVIGNVKIDDVLLFKYPNPVAHQAGITLTFDDYNVDGWYSMKEIFTEYAVTPTFFVSHFHRLSKEQIEKLKRLESIGAEIGCHSYNHKGVGRDYHYEVTDIHTYLKEEILPALKLMHEAGFNPQSFAYPFGEHEANFDNAIRAYFPYLRSTASDKHRTLSQLGEVYHKKGKHYRILSGDGIDNSYDNELEEIEEAFIKARKNQEIITLYGHEINNLNQRYSVSPEKLTEIIKLAQRLSLRFYTFKEAYLIEK